MNIFEAITNYAKLDFTNFDMSNNVVGTVKDFGSLTPIYWSTVIGSDTWKTSHNCIFKLPALVAPAFTRIKAVINTYYCSYASVWKHWNEFLPDRPSDNFFNKVNLLAYKDVFKEPCISAYYVSVICKIAHGFFNPELFKLSSISELPTSYSSMVSVGNELRGAFVYLFTTMHCASDGEYALQTEDKLTDLAPYAITWSFENGLRKATVTQVPGTIPQTASSSSQGFTHYVDSGFGYIGDSSTVPISYYERPTAFFPGTVTGLNVAEYVNKLGFYDVLSYFIYLCQQCVRTLQCMGVPTLLMAMTDTLYYRDKFINALPFFCISSIWENFYRDAQVQSPELDYSETNGLLCTTEQFNLLDGSDFPRTTFGWNIRFDSFPLNKGRSPIYYKFYHVDSIFSLLTGALLGPHLSGYISRSGDFNGIVFPNHYNALFITKYRNIEKDYFSSASLDPMQGRANIAVPDTLEELRSASKLEEFLERSESARDFYNFMKYNFGTNPESTRYQKPLLLGTKVIPIQISEQLQTSQTTDDSALGQRAGVADGYGSGYTSDHYFNEHGIIISFLSFVLDMQYYQGLNPELFHHNRLDYPFADFANLGAEKINTDELYYSNLNILNYDSLSSTSELTTLTNAQYTLVSPNQPSQQNLNGEDTLIISTSKIFGYTPRYSKWKFKLDNVFGQMVNEMDYWHTFRQFSQRPFLSHNFISYENLGFISNLNRIFAVVNDNADKFTVDIFNNCSVRRCLPLIPNVTLN